MSGGDDDPRSTEVRSLSWLVFGRVQGVGFRYHVLRSAKRIGVDGDVRNCPDGSVEVRARAAVDRLTRLSEEIRRGPSGARVERVTEQALDPDLAFDGFDVRF